jgi:DNA polymerase III delta subunit
LSLAALGVVYGDIGTSPLYAMHAVFANDRHPVPVDSANVLGVLSLVFWSLVIVVSLKYVTLILRADNRGEGGIMAQIALVQRRLANQPLGQRLIVLGLLGAALFCGEGIITPAISVLSAVEGLEMVTPGLDDWVIPLTLVILPRLDKLTKSSAWFAALESGVTLGVEPIERAALPQWIAQRMAAQGQRVSAGEEGQRTLQFFADRVEGNLLAAHQEIQKLSLLLPAGELSFEQIENAVLNVARYDVFKLSEAVLAGQAVRVQRMLDGLQAEGEAEVLVHYTLSEDIRALKRVKDAMRQGKPLPMALREQRVWGVKERLFERILPRLTESALVNLLHSAHQVDGIVKGLKIPEWPTDGWQALHRLALGLCQACAAPSASAQIIPSRHRVSP